MREGIFAHWPNRITLVRFLGSLALFSMFSRWEERAPTALETRVAFFLFVGIAATDFLDGYLARRQNLVTAFGRVADPFVDKVLVVGSMVFLAVFERSRAWFPAWLVVLVVAREFLVTGLRGYVESLGQQFPADWFGKVKMIVQCVAIGVVLGMFAFDWSDPLEEFLRAAAWVFMWGTLLTTLGSGLTYVHKTRRLLASEAR